MNLTPYIGIPFQAKGRTPAGMDCWGLVRLFYKNEFGIQLPSYTDDYVSSTDRKTVSQAITENIGSWQKVEKPQFGDMLLFQVLGLPLHTGIYIGDNDFLHAFRNTHSCIERINSITWSRRLLGVYRWAKT